MQWGRRRNPAKANRDLPDDIIEEILSRLPARSLLRFRSVHKQWLSLSSDPHFVQSNLKHLQSNHPCNKKLVLLLQESSQVCSVDYESPNNNNPIVLFNIPVPKPWSWISFGSCNGLLCIGICSREGDVRFIIWNPLLKNYKKVTDFYYRSAIYGGCSSNLVGFGYDSAADDYKLVCVDLYRKLVNVYTLKTASSRSFPLEPVDVFPFRMCVSGDSIPGKFFNGSLYWLAYYWDPSNINRKLIRFDLKDEKFRMVDVPGDHNRRRYQRRKSWKSELIVARECLYIVTMDMMNLHLKLLMMKVDKCNAISWSVGPNLEQPYGLRERPICITTDGGVLMRVKDNFGEKDKRAERLKEVRNEYEDGKPDDFSKYKLIINNPHTGTVDNIPIQGLHDWDESTTYLETLVSPI